MVITQIRRLQANRRSAFTLLEILVVVAIVVTMASVSGVYVFRYLEDSKKSKAQLDIKALETAVKAYQTKNNNEPPGQLRDALRFIDNATEDNLKDPWGKPYQYQVGDEHVKIWTFDKENNEINNLQVKQH